MISQSGPGQSRRGYGLLRELYPSLRIGVGSFPLGKRRGGKHHIRPRRGFGEEDILDHQKFETGEGMLDMRSVRIAHHGIFSHDVEGFDISFPGSRHHIRDRQADFVVESLNAPGLFELLSCYWDQPPADSR